VGTTGGASILLAGEVREQLANKQHGIFFVVGQEVSNAALAGVYRSSTQSLSCNIFIENCFHNLRAGDKHIAVLLFHHDEVL